MISVIVKDIKFKDNKIEVILDNGRFSISKENYIENPITRDSFIDEKRIEELLSKEKVIEAKMKIIRLLNRKIMSEWEAYKYLIDNEVDARNARKIIGDLSSIGLINDDYVCDILVDSLVSKRKGKLKIISYLKEKRIAEKIIEKYVCKIDEELYINNFEKVLEKYNKMYSNKSNKVKNNLVVSKLKEQGYEDKYINMIEFEENKDEELILARKNLLKIIKNKNINKNDYENINKIKIKLAMKGFNYDIINLVLKEVIEDETY